MTIYVVEFCRDNICFFLYRLSTASNPILDVEESLQEESCPADGSCSFSSLPFTHKDAGKLRLLCLE